MEIREFAEGILRADTLKAKLARAVTPTTDTNRGEAWRIVEPARPENLKFAARRQAPAMPKPTAFAEPQMRGVAHHIMANHELQAVEVMAFVLCAFPDAPAEFRQGLVQIIGDEQRHTRMHADRAGELGVPFGSRPVNCYIWKKAQSFASVLDYLAGLPLTFESRNLDHTLEFEGYFRQAGDRRGAAILRVIHRDEIEHVRFGLDWLRALKPANQSDWDAYRSHLQWPLRPAKACGEPFQTSPRLKAGMSIEFVQALRDATKDSTPDVS